MKKRSNYQFAFIGFLGALFVLLVLLALSSCATTERVAVQNETDFWTAQHIAADKFIQQLKAEAEAEGKEFILLDPIVVRKADTIVLNIKSN